eukprot:s2670_g14.t1
MVIIFHRQHDTKASSQTQDTEKSARVDEPWWRDQKGPARAPCGTKCGMSKSPCSGTSENRLSAPSWRRAAEQSSALDAEEPDPRPARAISSLLAAGRGPEPNFKAYGEACRARVL